MKRKSITVIAIAIVVVVFVATIYHKAIGMSAVGKKTSATTDINTEREEETFLPKDSNGKELNLIDYEDRYNVLIMELKKIDKNFEVEKYKFSVNLYTEDANDGLIKVWYYIGDKIKTNKVYVAIIENGQISEVSESLKSNAVDYKRLTAEEEKNMIDKVNRFLKERENVKENKTEEKVKERRTEILYDFLTGELKYIDSKFIVSDELDGAIVDKTTEIEIAY
ncbi:MAG: hypothetical protein Q4A72_04980 [Bacillota bacterium]|nr:hypothetical protein [Bacillota bacterium]